MTRNQRAFLDMIAWSEIGPRLLASSDNGYDLLFGGTKFKGYKDHPRIVISAGKYKSTAAGRYQILARYFDAYQKMLNLPDFSPASQDAIALQMIKEQRALSDIDSGHIKEAIHKCSNIWASFPGNDYGQPKKKENDLLQAYLNAGGVLA